jgi:hypothetical protein
MIDYGEQILTIAVLSILITAPLGAVRQERLSRDIILNHSRSNMAVFLAV